VLFVLFNAFKKKAFGMGASHEKTVGQNFVQRLCGFVPGRLGARGPATTGCFGRRGERNEFPGRFSQRLCGTREMEIPLPAGPFRPPFWRFFGWAAIFLGRSEPRGDSGTS